MASNRFAGAALLPAGRAHRSSGSGGEDDLVALARQPAPDDLLGASHLGSHGVDVGGVEEGNAGLDGGVHDLVGNRLVGLMTECRGAEAQSRNGETGGPESRVLHPIPPRTACHRAASANNRGGRAHVPVRMGTQLLLRFRCRVAVLRNTASPRHSGRCRAHGSVSAAISRAGSMSAPLLMSARVWSSV